MSKNNYEDLSTPKSSFWIYAFLLAIILLISFSIFQYVTRPKIAYVKMLDIVYGYNGMKDAHNEYTAQAKVWQSNIDTLKIRYSKNLAEYKASREKLSKDAKLEKEEVLKRMEADIKKYSLAISKQVKEKDEKVTESILNQINSFVEIYAIEHGYDVIFGAQGDGNIMYGSPKYDITEKVLTELNKEYKSLPKK